MNYYNQYAAQGMYDANLLNQYAAQTSPSYDQTMVGAQMAMNDWYAEEEERRARVSKELDWMRDALMRNR